MPYIALDEAWSAVAHKFQVLSTTIPAVALIYGAQKDKDCGGLIDSYETEKKTLYAN